jgi:hypothetical protein
MHCSSLLEIKLMKWLMYFWIVLISSLENHLECKHLLTADFQQGKFAIVSSVSEITLLTVDNAVTVDNQGRLFIGDCDEPV